VQIQVVVLAFVVVEFYVLVVVKEFLTMKDFEYDMEREC